MSGDVRLLVVSPAPETASRVNSALRGTGLVAQVEWARDDLDAVALLEQPYDLVFCELPRVQPARIVAAARKHTPALPVVGLADEIDDELLTGALSAGLSDLIVSSRAMHLAAAARRELDALAARRTVHSVSADAKAARSERDALFEHSGDALARAEDGILTDANGAWRELFGDDGALPGTPLMDLFDRASRTALKDALRAAKNVDLELVAVGGDGLEMPASVTLRTLTGQAPGMMEVAIRSGRGQRTLAEELERAQRFDASSGLLNRGAFLERLDDRRDDAVVIVRIDQFARVVEQMGVTGSDAVATQCAKLIAQQPHGRDAGRLEGTVFALTMSADRADVEAWCERTRDAIGAAVFEHGGRSTTLTASFGARLADRDASAPRLDDAYAALRKARAAGGNRVEVYAPPAPAHDTKEEAVVPDADWAQRIKQALMKGHFRLAFQPIASLRGDTSEAHDSLLRLMDPELGEVLPGVFLPAAQRVGLTHAIDRWVIGQAMKTLGDASHRKKGTMLFVRLSDESLKDESMVKWLKPQLQALKLEPGRLVFEISAPQAEKWLKESRSLASALKEIGCGILLGRFGTNPAVTQLLGHLPLDYVKFDVAVFDGLARDAARRDAMQETLELVAEKGIRSIAPGIEDANTMAVLWQLGVDFVQGNYLQEPEVVIAG